MSYNYKIIIASYIKNKKTDNYKVIQNTRRNNNVRNKKYKKNI